MRLSWCFPGQGSQSVGMGKELALTFASAREVFERADDTLGDKISSLCFEGPESELTLTRNTQPAIVTTSLAALAALKEALALPAPASAAGHSLGEYSALVASGALRLEDAVRLVRLRGEAMQEAVPEGAGAMAAIMGLSSEMLVAICEEAKEGEVVSPANFNAPGQIVIAGHAGAVGRAAKLAAERGGKAIPLKVSAPFHCALMAPAAAKLAAALERTEVGPLAFPVIANVDARPNQDESRVKELLVQQVDHPVRWEETIRAMASDGVTHILEIGPGKVLAGLVRRIAKEIEVLPVGTPAGIEAAAKLLTSRPGGS
jgi:[acyl-carrier-protein] S-malonyltransferase